MSRESMDRLKIKLDEKDAVAERLKSRLEHKDERIRELEEELEMLQTGRWKELEENGTAAEMLIHLRAMFSQIKIHDTEGTT